MEDHDREERPATSPATMADLEEVALRRAAATGKPVIVAGFASSGKATVFDVDLPDGAPLVEAGLDVAGVVPTWPSRPPRPPT